MLPLNLSPMSYLWSSARTSQATSAKDTVVYTVVSTPPSKSTSCSAGAEATPHRILLYIRKEKRKQFEEPEGPT